MSEFRDYRKDAALLGASEDQIRKSFGDLEPEEIKAHFERLLGIGRAADDLAREAKSVGDLAGLAAADNMHSCALATAVVLISVAQGVRSIDGAMILIIESSLVALLAKRSPEELFLLAQAMGGKDADADAVIDAMIKAAHRDDGSCE